MYHKAKPQVTTTVHIAVVPEVSKRPPFGLAEPLVLQRLATDYTKSQLLPRPPSKALSPVIPWTPGLIPEWDVLSVKNALNNHETGLFQNSAQMTTAMGRDDRIVAVMETRVKGLLSLPFQMEPAKVPRGKVRARKIAEMVEAFWPQIAPPTELSAAMWWFILLGIVPIQLTWKTVEGFWIPRLNVWDPQFLYWDDGDRTYKLNTQEGTLTLSFGTGEWMLMTQGDRGWMRGAIRSISSHWLSRQWVIRDWNRYNERHGLPLVKAMVPAKASADEKNQFFRDMVASNSSTVVMLPQKVDGNEGDFDLDLLEAKDRAWESFRGLEDQANKNIAINLLGQNLTTEVTGGSFAAAKIHNQIRMDRLQGDAEFLASAIKAQVLEPMVRFNFPDSAMLVPTPRWDTAPSSDLVAQGEAMKSLGEGVLALAEAGLGLSPNTIEEIGQEYSLELVPRGTETGSAHEDNGSAHLDDEENEDNDEENAA